MTHEMYKALIASFCEVAGLQDVERVQATGALVIDGLEVALAYNSSLTPDVVHIGVDLGTVPEDQEHRAYRTWLEINLIMSRWQSGQIGIDSSNGHATFSLAMALTTHTTGQDLAVTLDHAIEQAQRLREAVNFTNECPA